MFGRRRKSECHRIREMFSPYLDDCVTSVERDAVKYHIEICEDCEWELRSLGATVQLLSRMPAASAPRSFTLAEAPPRRDWVSFALPHMNRLRLATALAVLLLAILLAGDFSGLFHGDISAQPAEAAGDRVPTEAADPENVAPAMPGETAALPEEDPIGDLPEAWEPLPSPYPPDDKRIAQMVEPGLEWDLQAPLPEVPEAIAPLRKPYPWLRPLQIASATLVLTLGGTNLLVWRRRRGLTLNERQEAL